MIPNLTGNLSSVMNLVPLPGKMTILPLLKTDPLPVPIGPPYVVMFNPENYEEQQQFCYDDRQAQGTEGSNLKFHSTRPNDYSFEFLIDGTGASGDKREVTAEVLLFKALLKVNSVLHKPTNLLLIWGTFIKTCVCTGFSIRYTMFRPNGTPLRAIVKARFREQTNRVTGLLSMNFQSPDLTHKRQVQEGDTLPNLSNTVYESPRYYLEIARINGITNFRNLKRGTNLFLPPIEKQ